MQKFNKIAIIGAGDIGFNICEILALKGYDVTIYNRYHEVDGNPSPYWLSKMGRVMDMTDALQLPNCGKVKLTSNLDDLNESNYVIITAGAKRGSIDETREELAAKNAKIMKSYANFIAHNPQALVMIISNPIDFLTNYTIREVAKTSNKTNEEISKKIIGVSYVDTMRLINAIKDLITNQFPELENPVVEGIVLGEHGPAMVPIMSAVTINAKPISEFFTNEQIEIIRNQTILRGNDIIKLTGNSSVLGPAHAVMHMVEQIDINPKVQIVCSVWDGERVIGQLTEFTARQVSSILDVNKSTKEEQMMANSCRELDKQYNYITQKFNL